MNKMSKEKIFLLISMILLLWIGTFVFMQNSLERETSWSGTLFSWALQVNDKTKENSQLVIKFIEDKRNPDTNMDSFIENFKNQEKFVKNAKIQRLDFSDDSVKKYLEKNNITKLPVVIFSTNDFDEETEVKKFLTKMDSSEYYLEIWAIYNPFTASARWLQILNKNVLESIKNDSFFENENNKEIIWLEYSDLSCIYCRNFRNSWIPEEILKNHKNISKTFNHFIAHKTQDKKFFEVLECSAEQKGKDIFFSLLNIWFKNSIFDKDSLVTEAIKLWVDKQKLETCLLESRFATKVESQDKRATESFWVTWTPTNIFINAETWEYKIVAWFDEKTTKEQLEEAIKSVETKK